MNNNNPIKARLYIGGLKSLFVDIVNTLEEIENTGNVPIDLLQTLEDVKNAIDMTVNQLKRTSAAIKCCEHAPEPTEEKVCEACEQPFNECECESVAKEIPLSKETNKKNIREATFPKKTTKNKRNV